MCFRVETLKKKKGAFNRKQLTVITFLCDVDFEGQAIRVQPKVDWHTKNYKMRAIPIHPDLLKILRDHRQSQNGMFVFCNDGKPLQNIRRSFNKAIQKAGIPHVTFHALRHTFASHMVMKGVDLATVQQHLGHADIQTTMRYAHLALALASSPLRFWLGMPLTTNNSPSVRRHNAISINQSQIGHNRLFPTKKGPTLKLRKSLPAKDAEEGSRTLTGLSPLRPERKDRIFP